MDAIFALTKNHLTISQIWIRKRFIVICRVFRWGGFFFVSKYKYLAYGCYVIKIYTRCGMRFANKVNIFQGIGVHVYWILMLQPRCRTCIWHAFWRSLGNAVEIKHTSETERNNLFVWVFFPSQKKLCNNLLEQIMFM